MCQSDLPQCAYVVLDVLFFTVLCFRHGFHKAVILFLKQLPHPWETLPGGGRESPLIKLCRDVHSERRCLCTHGVTIGFVSLRTVVLAVSFERSNACAYGSSCLGVLQKISPKDSQCPSFKVCGIQLSGAASHGLQTAYTCLGSNMGSGFSQGQHSEDGNWS